MQLLYHVRRKGSAAKAAFTFKAVAPRYNPRKAGRTAQRSGCTMCNHYIMPALTTVCHVSKEYIRKTGINIRIEYLTEKTFKVQELCELSEINKKLKKR